jgi:hypothetical protein
MGMGINKNIRVSAVVYEKFKNFVDISALGGTGIELAVGKRPGTSFTITIVGIRIYHRLPVKAGDILSP